MTRDRFGPWIERRDDADFPFYAGSPIAISTGRWAVLWAACLAALLVLTLLQLAGAPGLVAQIAFTTIMVVALAWAGGRRWTAIFRRVRLRDVGLMVLLALMGFLVAGVAALAVRHFFPVSANPASGGPPGGAEQAALEWVGDAVQLLGEELLTVLPFLALLHVLTRQGSGRCTSRCTTGTSRRPCS